MAWAAVRNERLGVTQSQASLEPSTPSMPIPPFPPPRLERIARLLPPCAPPSACSEAPGWPIWAMLRYPPLLRAVPGPLVRLLSPSLPLSPPLSLFHSMSLPTSLYLLSMAPSLLITSLRSIPPSSSLDLPFIILESVYVKLSNFCVYLFPFLNILWSTLGRCLRLHALRRGLLLRRHGCGGGG